MEAERSGDNRSSPRPKSPVVSQVTQYRGYQLQVHEAEALRTIENYVSGGLLLLDPNTEVDWDSKGIVIQNNLVTGLGLYGCDLPTFPMEITDLQHLTHLSIYSNNIAVFPEKLGTMVSLRFAYLGGNPITSLPHSFGNLVNLHTCWLNSCNLSYIPDSIGNLKGMSRLSLASNELQSLPDSITNLRNMSILWIRENPNLILSAYHLQWIQEIKSSGTTVYDSNIGNQLAAPASGLASFRGKNIAGYEADALKKLEIRLNRELPLLADTETIEWDTVGIRISNGQVTGLGLYSVGLSQFPDEILQLDNLTSLSVYSNEISYLPEEIGDLFQLEYAYLGGNPLTSLPYRIGDLRNLNTCWLNTCQLQSIPDSIGNLGQIYRLSIASNQLTSLPDSIMNLNRMNIFWIRENPNLNLSRKQKKWLNEIENRGTTIYAEGVKR